MINKEFTLPVIKIQQPIGYFYLGKMKASVLKQVSATEMADMKRESIENYIGEQRRLIPRKVKQIQKYVRNNDATFPASIILNMRKESVISESDDEIVFRMTEDCFTIIDGQHRLFAFDNNDIDFDLPVSIFIGLTPDKSARMFSTLNSTQTPVNPSLNMYLELNDKVWTPRKMVVEIADMFNHDRHSPLANRIKYNVPNEELDRDKSNISLQTFSQAILRLIYDDENDFYYVRDRLVLDESDLLEEANHRKLWEFYYERKEELLYKILLNYFSAIRNVFSSDWKSKDSLIIKTTGYNAFMFLFSDLYDIGLKNNDLTEKFFESYIMRAKDLGGQFYSDKFGTSGWSASKVLYEELKKRVLYDN